MKPKRTSFAIVHYSIFTIFLLIIAPKSFGLVGTTSFTVNEGNTTNPTYYIASAPISQLSVYSGAVVSTDNSNARLTFSVDSNASGANDYPFEGVSAFVPNVQLPVCRVSVSSGALDSNTSVVWLDEGGSVGFDTNKPGFNSTYPPEVLLYDAESNTSAEVNATVNSDGKLTGLSVLDQGSGYTSTPKVYIVAGPHFVKIADPNSDYNGMVFLIKDNTRTTLDLDLSRRGDNDSQDVSHYFPNGTQVEVIPATTLGSLFGVDHDSSSFPANWSVGLPHVADWIYLWDVDFGGYVPYIFLDDSLTSRGYSRGWIKRFDSRAGLMNHAVIYPDESFLIAKMTSGNVTFEFEGEIDTDDKKLLLPESGNQILAKNPYGADMLLAELIPSTMITAKDGNASLFRAGTSSEDGDLVTFLVGTSWKQFWYDHNHGNTSVSSMHVIGTRRPLESDANASTMDEDDFYIGSGTVSAMERSNASGDTNSSDKSYTKIVLSGARSDINGFTITFSDVQGYLLSEDGSQEMNASTSQPSTPGSVVDSNLNGSFEIIECNDTATPSFIVIEKQLDIRFDSSDSNLGTANWKIGQLGSGYDTNATFYCVGGNTGTDANGTISSTGTITVGSNGTSYSSKPQVIVSGGGWRFSDGATRDSEILGATSGIIIQRNSALGNKAYIESLNPF
jgi:hypothetical protein